MEDLILLEVSIAGGGETLPLCHGFRKGRVNDFDLFDLSLMRGSSTSANPAPPLR